jgi:hypothetical protein
VNYILGGGQGEGGGGGGGEREEGGRGFPRTLSAGNTAPSWINGGKDD